MTARAYEYIRNHAPRVAWASVVWTSYTPPKYSFILWLALRGRIQTKDRLSFMNIDPTCQFCGYLTESSQHLFFACPFSQAVWKDIRWWCGLTRGMTTLTSGVKWLRRTARGTSTLSMAQRLAFSCTVYYIWMFRNRLIFEQYTPAVQEVVRKIQTQVYQILFTRYPSCLYSLVV